MPNPRSFNPQGTLTHSWSFSLNQSRLVFVFHFSFEFFGFLSSLDLIDLILLIGSVLIGSVLMVQLMVMLCVVYVHLSSVHLCTLILVQLQSPFMYFCFNGSINWQICFDFIGKFILDGFGLRLKMYITHRMFCKKFLLKNMTECHCC